MGPKCWQQHSRRSGIGASRLALPHTDGEHWIAVPRGPSAQAREAHPAPALAPDPPALDPDGSSCGATASPGRRQPHHQRRAAPDRSQPSPRALRGSELERLAQENPDTTEVAGPIWPPHAARRTTSSGGAGCGRRWSSVRTCVRSSSGRMSWIAGCGQMPPSGVGSPSMTSGDHGRSTIAKYDLFVALQVFEHLRDRQREAFREVRRVARHAIISLPIGWRWTARPDPTTGSPRRPCESGSRRSCRHGSSRATVAATRVIYVFEDLPAA